MIKLFSIDWEGCMMEPGTTTPWWAESLPLLGKCLWTLPRAVGVIPVFNTGRPGPFIEAGILALDFVTPTPHLCENGAVLWFPQSTDWKVNTAITQTSLMHFTTAKNMARNRAIVLGGTVALGKEFSCTLYPPSGMSVNYFFALIVNHLEGREMTQHSEITHSAAAVDLTSRGVSKATGLLDVCNRYACLLDEVAAIGDSEGDMGVLEVVGLPMCPANASPPVKELVARKRGYISSYRTTKGLADCMMRISDDPELHRLATQLIEMP